jgi:hypothetical protein
LAPWRFSVIAESPEIGLLHFTDTGRAIQFVFIPDRPEKLMPMRLWFFVESATQLRFRYKPDQGGRLRGYRFSGDTMTFFGEDYCVVFTRPLPDEIPEWFHPALASALARPCHPDALHDADVAPRWGIGG